MNTLTKKVNLKMLKQINMILQRKRLQNQIESKMDEAIAEGDFDKVLECKFLKDRLWCRQDKH